jgi:hypothetical protein
VPPCERRNTRLSSSPSKTGALGEITSYLKLENPRFLFLEGSGGAAVAPVAVAIALAGAPVALAGASAARASPTDLPAAGASAPATDACSSTASAALGDGVGDSTSWGARPPSLSSSSSSDDEFSGVPGGESLLLA